jgi:ArsR family transcriptional regulator
MEGKDNLRVLIEVVEQNFTEEDFEILATFFKAFAHPLRLKILLILYTAKDKKVCVSNIVDLLGVSQPNVSQHLFILRSAGIVDCQRDKNFVCYTLRSRLAEKILKLILEEKRCISENEN